jgi:hypothetical protein
MAYELSTKPKSLTGTAAELAAMTAAEKLTIPAGSTYWAWDTKAGYIFAAGDWRAV